MSGMIAGAPALGAASTAPAVGAPLEVEPIIFPNLGAELDALMRVELNLDETDLGSWFRWTAFTEREHPTPLNLDWMFKTLPIIS